MRYSSCTLPIERSIRRSHPRPKKPFNKIISKSVAQNLSFFHIYMCRQKSAQNSSYLRSKQNTYIIGNTGGELLLKLGTWSGGGSFWHFYVDFSNSKMKIDLFLRFATLTCTGGSIINFIVIFSLSLLRTLSPKRPGYSFSSFYCVGVVRVR